MNTSFNQSESEVLKSAPIPVLILKPPTLQPKPRLPVRRGWRGPEQPGDDARHGPREVRRQVRREGHRQPGAARARGGRLRAARLFRATGMQFSDVTRFKYIDVKFVWVRTATQDKINPKKSCRTSGWVPDIGTCLGNMPEVILTQ